MSTRCPQCDPVCHCVGCGAPAMHIELFGDRFSTGRCDNCHRKRGAEHDRWTDARLRAEEARTREARAARDEESGKVVPITQGRRVFE